MNHVFQVPCWRCPLGELLRGEGVREEGREFGLPPFFYVFSPRKVQQDPGAAGLLACRCPITLELCPALFWMAPKMGLATEKGMLLSLMAPSHPVPSLGVEWGFPFSPLKVTF